MTPSGARAFRSLSRLANLAMSQAFRCLPPERRFGAVVHAADVFNPVLRRTPGFRALLESFPLNDERDVAVRMLLGGFIRSRTAFDPPFVVYGEPLIDRLVSSGRGILVLGAHGMLNTLMMRYLYDRGLMPSVIAAEQMYFDGTDVPIPLIRYTSSFLVQVRTSLLAGGVVCGSPDHTRDNRRTRPFRVKSATVNISNGLMRVATRVGAAIVFMAIRLGDDDRVHLYFDAPSGNPPDAARAQEEFGEFLRSVADGTAREAI